MELQSGLGKVSVIREVSALQRCPLREVPLYWLLHCLFVVQHMCDVLNLELDSQPENHCISNRSNLTTDTNIQ